MEYLKPIENLEKEKTTYKILSIGLFGLLVLAIVALPEFARRANPILIKNEKGIVLSEVEPWKLSVARVEEFTKAYLTDRFVWSETDITQKRQSLVSITTPAVMTKLKDSVQAFEAMTHNQKAKSYYVLEEFHFSNEDKKVSAQITRILRIQNAAIATPLKIEFSYTETALTPENPFGLQVSSLNEAEVTSQ